MRAVKTLIALTILIIAWLIWEFAAIINMGGLYTDDYEFETDIPKSEFLMMLKENPYFVDDKDILENYCVYDNKRIDQNRTYIRFKYSVNNIEYIHSCLVSEKWNEKSLLIYYYINGSGCEGVDINKHTQDRKEFISKFEENVVDLVLQSK